MKKRIFEFPGLVFRIATVGDVKNLMNLQVHWNKINVPKNKWAQGFLSLLSEEEHLVKCINAQRVIVAHKANKPGEILGFALFMSEETASSIHFMKPFADLVLKIRDDSGDGNMMLHLSSNGDNFIIMAQLFVLPELAGKNVENELYKRVVETLENHVKFVVTGLSTDNKSGIKLLKKLKFTEHTTYHTPNNESFTIFYKRIRR